LKGVKEQDEADIIQEIAEANPDREAINKANLEELKSRLDEHAAKDDSEYEKFEEEQDDMVSMGAWY